MKWEYRVLPSDTLHRFDGMDCQAMLTEQGDKGWELVAVRQAPAMEGYDYFIFKRAVMVELSVVGYTYEDAQHAVDGS